MGLANNTYDVNMKVGMHAECLNVWYINVSQHNIAAL